MANQGGARIADEDRFEELPDANDDEVVESDEDEEEAISDSEQYGRQTPPGERIRQRRQKRRSRRRRQQREAGFEDGGGLDVWHDDDDDESDFDEEDIIETHYPPEGYDSASPSSSTDSHLAGIPPELRARTADLLAEAQAANTLSPRAELAFDTAIWTIPLVSVYVLLDVLVRQQYGQPVFWGGVVRRVVSRGPCEFFGPSFLGREALLCVCVSLWPPSASYRGMVSFGSARGLACQAETFLLLPCHAPFLSLSLSLSPSPSLCSFPCHLSPRPTQLLLAQASTIALDPVRLLRPLPRRRGRIPLRHRQEHLRRRHPPNTSPRRALGAEHRQARLGARAALVGCCGFVCLGGWVGAFQ